MNSKVLVGLVVLLVGVGAGWYFLQGSKPAPGAMKKESGVMETTTPAVEPTTSLGTELPATGSTGGVMDKGGVPSSGSAMAKSSVSYGAGGFVPKTVTVKKGTSVVWTNQSQGGMWVASAVHPTHQLLPGFDELKSVGAGGMYEYTFTKVGTWKYHNHVQASDTGTVVVTE
ncbi:hypothetical protein HY032_02535 [Candidatus Gottesmanbacteria bacterium]|nr:hypothetical protein [Candidatus Gottesmanbacteria bacterium]